MEHSPEFNVFDGLVGKVLSVSHEEIKRREAEYERTHPKRKRGRPKKIQPPFAAENK
ncbi:MAG TPA: hypothetical protein VG897_12895 [Terriglobales bacterium]|nr:hypothetical protein [Terriglobales bacterium]